jgi:hypothetical protein
LVDSDASVETHGSTHRYIAVFNTARNLVAYDMALVEPIFSVNIDELIGVDAVPRYITLDDNRPAIVALHLPNDDLLIIDAIKQQELFRHKLKERQLSIALDNRYCACVHSENVSGLLDGVTIFRQRNEKDNKSWGLVGCSRITGHAVSLYHGGLANTQLLALDKDTSLLYVHLFDDEMNDTAQDWSEGYLLRPDGVTPKFVHIGYDCNLSVARNCNVRVHIMRWDLKLGVIRELTSTADEVIAERQYSAVQQHCIFDKQMNTVVVLTQLQLWGARWALQMPHHKSVLAKRQVRPEWSTIDESISLDRISKLYMTPTRVVLVKLDQSLLEIVSYDLLSALLPISK